MIRFTHLSGNPSAVSNYTANERSQEKGIGYYSEKGGAPSQWLGSGAEKQGLSGRVDKDDLERALSGITTDGEDLSKRGNHEGKRRMGTDLTFSAPKSVSILAVRDDRIAAAHDKAVANAMRYVESDMAYARLGKGGCKTEYTGSITAAAFRHEDSRSVDGKVDPHLHTHVIVSNMTQRADGTWVSLRLDMGHGNVKQNILDEIYKSELARELKKAGYELEQTKDGFEIKGITREEIEAFSSRSREIADDLSKNGIDRKNATEAQRTAAQNTTRKGKTQLSKEDQRWEWRDRVRSEGIDADRLIAEAKNRPQLQQPDRDRQQIVREALKSGIRHVGERNTVFSQAELELEAMKSAMGEFDINDVRQTIKNKTGGLLDAGQTDRDGTGKIEQRYTTKTHLYREAEILQRAKDGQGKAIPIIQKHEPLQRNDEPVFINSEKEQQENENLRSRSNQSGFNDDKPLSELNMRSLQSRYLDADQARQNPGILSDHAQPDRPGDQGVRWPGESGNSRVAAIIKEREAKQGFSFSDGQRAGVNLALTSTDRHLGIVGAAGAGKTTSMSLIVEQYQKAGYEVIGVAPSAAAARELEAAGCHETVTLASALLKKEKDKPGKRLYVLDEAGMVSAKDFDDFYRKADSENARTLSVGDPLQLQSVEAGSAYKQLLDTGAIKSIKIDEIQRQKDPQLKEIAQAFADGNADRGVELAQPYMQQVTVSKDEDKTEKLADAASASYLSLSKDEREQTLLLVGTNKTRNAINEKVRAGLVEQGEVGKETIIVTALDKSDMTREASKKAKNYTNGMIVEFMDKEKWGDRGSRWEVMGKGDKDNQIILQSLDQEKTITVDPGKIRLSVYEKREMQLAQGDQVMFKKNDKDRDIINGSMGKIIDVDQNTGKARIQLRSGQMVSVSSKQMENLDYAYARTVHSSQGATVERAIVVGESGKVSTAQIAYVACSREKTGLQIITDDTEKLSKSWSKYSERQNAIKVTRHEITQTLPELQKSRKEAEKELHEPQPKKQQQQEIKPPQPISIPKKKKDKGKNKDMELEM
ncbi:MobF family relaxase [Acidithiobacillus thiooxidans]|uniref:Multifunctional conjugation protein TraI n=1 Tax=Acidithiobacillus thiooxidans ATCC 19377 TaxID=637390 RepID=A0A543Q3K6_ACITH|nr:MobF family relaxase [Acidithiobacillus thiooxidans]MDX5934958.1 MobF family relaxase [Acidithiobacillus thiooxidans]TQN50917.1 Multifunctional conjugation protein TraI [Acidithiobacillus thiooxidans ATCC 19377]